MWSLNRFENSKNQQLNKCMIEGKNEGGVFLLDELNVDNNIMWLSRAQKSLIRL